MFHLLRKIVHCNIFLSNERFFFQCRNCLLLTDFHITNSNGASIIVDAPAVFLYAIDALGVGTYIVDVGHDNRVISVDVDVVGVIGGTCEPIAVDALDEALAIDLYFFAFIVFLQAIALLLKVNLAAVLIFGIDHQRVVKFGISAAHERDAELVPSVPPL